MGLNMSRQNIVDAALDLERELEEYQDLITRYDSATLV
jgi:hypothetical protein